MNKYYSLKAHFSPYKNSNNELTYNVVVSPNCLYPFISQDSIYGDENDGGALHSNAQLSRDRQECMSEGNRRHIPSGPPGPSVTPTVLVPGSNVLIVIERKESLAQNSLC